MKGLNDYSSIPEYTDSVKLPAGAYEITIIRAEEKSEKTGDQLCLLFDISDGEYKNYYVDKFNADKKNFPKDAKYKGVLRLWYPNGGQYDDSNKKRMKTTLERIKQSNNLRIDFSKDWDGAALKGCKVGMIFREQEWSYNGMTGMTAQPYQVITLDALRNGNFTLPNPKYLSQSDNDNYVPNNNFVPLAKPEPDDLPF